MNDKTLTKFADELFAVDAAVKHQDEMRKINESVRLPDKCNRDFGEPNGWHYLTAAVACPFVLYAVASFLFN